MKRREFIGLLVGGASAFPRGSSAQQTSPVIGFLSSQSRAQWTERIAAFMEGLRANGYVEGENVLIEYRWAENQNDRLAGFAAELVRRGVAVIVVLGNTPSALAAKAASATTPVVFRVAVDPVEAGLVASINRPGGNITGISTQGTETGKKQLELLHQLIPKVNDISLLINPSNAVLSKIQSRDLQLGANSLGLTLSILTATTDEELELAFARFNTSQAKGLVIGADAFLNSRSEKIAELAIIYKIPAIAPYRQFAVAGGLMSYGGSIDEGSRLAGIYTGRILKGEKPANLPVQLTKVGMVLNSKTAKILGLEVPPAIFASADEVIE